MMKRRGKNGKKPLALASIGALDEGQNKAKIFVWLPVE
jgi:hypothetical protein